MPSSHDEPEYQPGQLPFQREIEWIEEQGILEELNGVITKAIEKVVGRVDYSRFKEYSVSRRIRGLHHFGILWILRAQGKEAWCVALDLTDGNVDKAEALIRAKEKTHPVLDAHKQSIQVAINEMFSRYGRKLGMPKEQAEEWRTDLWENAFFYYIDDAEIREAWELRRDPPPERKKR